MLNLCRSLGNLYSIKSCLKVPSRNYAHAPNNISNINVTLRTIGGSVQSPSLFQGKKVVVVGVPGAFTSACSKQVPEYAKRVNEFKAKGVDKIYIISINDHFVLDAWRDALKIKDEVTFLADQAGDFTREIGQEVDLSAAGLGKRSQRYSLFIDNGNVVYQQIEVSPGNVDASAADVLLKKL